MDNILAAKEQEDNKFEAEVQNISICETNTRQNICPNNAKLQGIEEELTLIQTELNNRTNTSSSEARSPSELQDSLLSLREALDDPTLKIEIEESQEFWRRYNQLWENLQNQLGRLENEEVKISSAKETQSSSEPIKAITLLPKAPKPATLSPKSLKNRLVLEEKICKDSIELSTEIFMAFSESCQGLKTSTIKYSGVPLNPLLAQDRILMRKTPVSIPSSSYATVNSIPVNDKKLKYFLEKKFPDCLRVFYINNAYKSRLVAVSKYLVIFSKIGNKILSDVFLSNFHIKSKLGYKQDYQYFKF
ncbi:unnamed protein product [Moneuplotes crassus]|uniref:Uncharacterized protein n=1 Tax=Euplotes crassus TaxID=5936 RepID=A0AAD1U793_EUPCR|nr:unnamed protein product [Moneuplotes crassus]